MYGNGFINDFCCFGVDCEKSFFEFFLGSNQENENFFAFECQLGCLVFHFCKDTIELLSENLHVFIEKNKKIEKKYEFEEIDEKYNEIKDKNKEIEDKNKEIEGIDAGSIYYEIFDTNNENSNKIFHFHSNCLNKKTGSF